MAVRDIEQVVVEIEHQFRTGLARMLRQPVCRIDVGDGVSLGDDDLGVLVVYRFYIRHSDIEPAGRRVVQRL